MSTVIVESKRIELIKLRRKKHYRRAQHTRASKRQEKWKAKALQLESVVRQFQTATAEQSQGCLVNTALTAILFRTF